MGKVKTKNKCYVHVKQDRYCEHCSNKITKGSKALTINKRFEGRVWFCLKCVELKKQIEETKAEMECISFGDDGGYMALQDALAELEAEYYE